MAKEIKNLDPKKPVPQDIPVKLLKLNDDIFSQYLSHIFKEFIPAGIYLLKVNNRNTRTRCEKCSKVKIKKPTYWRRSSFFIVNFEHISHLALVFLLLSLSR